MIYLNFLHKQSLFLRVLSNHTLHTSNVENNYTKIFGTNDKKQVLSLSEVGENRRLVVLRSDFGISVLIPTGPV